MLDYTTNLIDERICKEKEISEKETNEDALKRILRQLEGNTDYIHKYFYLFRLFDEFGKSDLYLYHDIKSFKGYYYLAAKAGQICFQLYEKGYRIKHSTLCTNSYFEQQNSNFNFAFHAMLAGSNQLAIELALKDSSLEAALKGDFEQAKEYLPTNVKDIHFSDSEVILWTILYNDEKKMNHYIEKRTKEIRRYDKKCGFASDYIDHWTLALLKLAKERGMKCNLDVIELPLYVLDDDTPVNEEEWKLPEDKELEKMLQV